MSSLAPPPKLQNRPSITLRPISKPSRNNIETADAQWEIEQKRMESARLRREQRDQERMMWVSDSEEAKAGRKQSVHGDMQQCRAHADHMASEQQRRDLQLKSEVKQRAALEKQLEVEQREARRNVGNSVMEENKRLMEMRREELKAQKLREIEQDLANLELFNERWGSTPR